MITDKNIEKNQDFTSFFASKLNITIKDANVIKHTFLKSIEEYLQNNEKITFSGWGIFKKVLRKARTAYGLTRKQADGTYGSSTINIPEKKVIKFVVGKNLKTSIENS